MRGGEQGNAATATTATPATSTATATTRTATRPRALVTTAYSWFPPFRLPLVS